MIKAKLWLTLAAALVYIEKRINAFNRWFGQASTYCIASAKVIIDEKGSR